MQCEATYPPRPGSTKHSWRPPFLQLRRACPSFVVALTNFGSNPTNTGMYVYKPTTFTLAAKPAVLVAIHECTASGPVYFRSTPYAQLVADTNGFIVHLSELARLRDL